MRSRPSSRRSSWRAARFVPTAGLDEPEAALELLHVPHVGREVARVRAAVSNAFGFGGMDTVLVFAPASHDEPAASGRPARAATTRGDAASPVDGADAASLGGSSSRAPRSSAHAACSAPTGAPRCLTRRHAPREPLDPDPLLDVARSRRLDFAARLAAVAVEHALQESGAPRDGVGVILGSAFGNVDGCAAFMHRIFEKGPRMASPAEFPNLVPSAPVGHVSIYGGLHGPAFGTSDLSASGESAVVQAWQLVMAGEAARMVAGLAEPRSDIAERVLSALFDDAPPRSGRPRADVAAAVVLEDESAALARKARVLARVERVFEWRVDGPLALADLRAPRGAGAQVVVVARVSDAGERVLAQTPWRECPRVACADSLGDSDALGAVAVAVAASRIAAGSITEALVLGVAQRRGYAILLAGP